MPKQVKPEIVLKKNRKGTSIEFKNINMNPEELHSIVEGVKKGGKEIEGAQR